MQRTIVQAIASLALHWVWGLAVLWTHLLVVAVAYGEGEFWGVDDLLDPLFLRLGLFWLATITLILVPLFEWAVRGRDRKRASIVYTAFGIGVAALYGLVPVFDFFLFLSTVLPLPLPFFTLPFVALLLAIREDQTGFYGSRC